MTMAAPWLDETLKEVSRSFYKTVRVLPGAVRPQIGLAYLLARATDTLADTEAVPVSERLAALEALRARIEGAGTGRLDFTPFLSTAAVQAGPRPGVATAGERRLLTRIEGALDLLGTFARSDQDLIRELLRVITSGQELDVRRFGRAPAVGGAPAAPEVVALRTDAELEDYIHRVAGCVGEFWTRICRAHLFPEARLDEAWLIERGVRFGKGLQLVNVLRDLPRDLRAGRCYLPEDRLAEAGLRPADLLEASSLGRLRPCYDAYLDRAAACLEAGWAYTNALPRGQVRVRLACAWPILIGVRTLSLLRRGQVLEPGARIKVTRPEVRRLLFNSVVCYGWPAAWDRLFQSARR